MKLTEEEFQTKVLEQTGSCQKQIETLLKNYDQLHADTKSTMEDLTKVKNENGTMAEKIIAMQKLTVQLHRERSMAFGNDPLKRLLADEDARNQVRTWVITSLQLQGQAKGLVQKADLAESGTPGSVYVPNAEVEQLIYDTLLQFGAYRTLDVRTVSTKAVEVPIMTARPLFVFLSEAGQMSADATKAGSRSTVTPKKIGCLIPMSTELLEDASLPLMQDLMSNFADAFAERMDAMCFAADGTNNSTFGGFTGMFNGGTAVTAAAAGTSVAATVYTDWLKCLTGIDAAVLQRAARWWIHPLIVAAAMGVKDANGRPIFLTAIESPSFGAMGSIFGFPVTMVGNAPSTDAANKQIAAFGDPMDQAVRIRRDLTIDRSDHFKFDTDEITFRATGRVATKTKIATGITVLNTHA